MVTTNQTGYDKTKKYVFESLLKLNITIPWIQGLSFTGNAAVDKSIENNKLWEKPWYLYSWDGVTYDANDQPVLLKGKRIFTPQLTQKFSDGRLMTLNALLNYERAFNNVHDFRFLAGTEGSPVNPWDLKLSGSTSHQQLLMSFLQGVTAKE